VTNSDLSIAALNPAQRETICHTACNQACACDCVCKCMPRSCVCVSVYFACVASVCMYASYLRKVVQRGVKGVPARPVSQYNVGAARRPPVTATGCQCLFAPFLKVTNGPHHEATRTGGEVVVWWASGCCYGSGRDNDKKEGRLHVRVCAAI